MIRTNSYDNVDPQLLLLLLRTVEELSNLRAPIIFKGAIILKNALIINNINPGTERFTTDIDGDWCDVNASLNIIEDTVDKAVSNVDSNLIAVLIRTPGMNKSAGIGVLDRTDANTIGIRNVRKKDCIFTLDFSIRQNPFSTFYISALNGVRIQAATLQKMFTDKLRAVSEPIVRRRVKDVYDLYILSVFSDVYTTSGTYEICEVTGKCLNNFDIFLNDIGTINHAYNLMNNIVNKPDFCTLYKRVYHFIEPFIEKAKNVNLTWNGNDWI